LHRNFCHRLAPFLNWSARSFLKAEQNDKDYQQHYDNPSTVIHRRFLR
jgi:hypothetical protein